MSRSQAVTDALIDAACWRLALHERAGLQTVYAVKARAAALRHEPIAAEHATIAASLAFRLCPTLRGCER